MVKLTGSGSSACETPLVRNVLELLDRTEYRRCDTAEDREAIYRLRYKAYRPHGFVPEMPDGLVKDGLDDLPNSHCFAVFIDGHMLATVRLHAIDNENPYGPAVKGFGDTVLPMIARGESFINPSMFAADPELNREFRGLPYVSLRLVILAYEWFRSTHCACIIREEHTSFYRRIFGAREMVPARLYPPISIPLMLYGGVCAKEFGPIVERFPFFRSTEAERRMLFGPANQGLPRPLTVLPTAKYGMAAA